jgi:16S rRNA (cytosine1402-N4)-methyltransferase
MALVYHVPALLNETLEALQLSPGRRVVDATLGGGGHAIEIARRIAPGGVIIGIDQDAEARAAATERLSVLENVTCEIHAANFAQMDHLGIAPVDGVVMDLGVSSHQLDVAERGFAIRYQGPLDMRMDGNGEGETAAEMLNRLSEREIADILFQYGEESRAKRIAAEIVARRPLVTTEDLVDTVRRTMPMGTRPGQIHPATKTFQAVRIAVNRELEVLEQGLVAAVALLKPGGRLVVISYHSLEDRIVKQAFSYLAGKREGSDFGPTETVEVLGQVVTKKPIVPTEDEVRANPRARSAKLRVWEKY